MRSARSPPFPRSSCSRASPPSSPWPLRPATLTVHVGFPYVALLNAEGIFAAVRAIDASFKADDSALSWKEMAEINLARLEDHGVAAAFLNEVAARAAE